MVLFLKCYRHNISGQKKKLKKELWYEVIELKNFSKKDYQNLVSHHEKSPWLKNLIFAFVIGGFICVLGQIVMNFAKNMGLPKEDAGCVTSMTLIFLSGLLTGLVSSQRGGNGGNFLLTKEFTLVLFQICTACGGGGNGENIVAV